MSDKSPFYAAAELPDDDTDYEREIATQDRLTTANDLLREAVGWLDDWRLDGTGRDDLITRITDHLEES